MRSSRRRRLFSIGAAIRIRRAARSNIARARRTSRRISERKSVTLLNEFVEQVQKELPEQTVFFDRNPSSHSQFHGNGAQPATLTKYGQCNYFVILDDRYYDQSENCRAECNRIRERLAELAWKGLDIDNHLRLLHPTNESHCELYEEFRDNGGYSGELSKKSVEELARAFVETIRDSE